jgi:osmotically-inducible protein OsmY
MSIDDHLRNAVIAELHWEPGVTAAHIGVTANDGVVTLSGHVDDLVEKHTAEAAARRVKGVKAVAGEIEVRLRPETHRTDDEIAAAAVERLAWDVSVPSDSVQVTVENGWITLTGEVDWHFQKMAAEQDLQRLFGVVGVTNEVTIKSRVIASGISDEIMHALHRSWFFDPRTINVTADDGTVWLSGTVHSAHERQIAAATAWAAPGVTDVVNEITII